MIMYKNPGACPRPCLMIMYKNPGACLIYSVSTYSQLMQFGLKEGGKLDNQNFR